jgi:hypothetical protein
MKIRTSQKLLQTVSPLANQIEGFCFLSLSLVSVFLPVLPTLLIPFHLAFRLTTYTIVL